MRLGTLGLLLFGRHVAAKRAAALDHLFGYFTVSRGLLELVGDLAIVLEVEPIQPVDQRFDRLGRRARAIGVLDPQQVLAAHPPRIEPVEKSRSRAADMEVACGRGGEACDDAHRGEFRVVKARAW